MTEGSRGGKGRELFKEVLGWCPVGGIPESETRLPFGGPGFSS